MAGAWRGGLQWGHPVTYGVQTPSASATPFTKGSWNSISASTPTDSTWAQIMLRAASTPGATLAVDIGTGGAGSELVVVNNLVCNVVGVRTVDYLMPLNIAAGTRVVCRVSATKVSDACAVQLVTFDDSYFSSGGSSSILTYGFTSASNTGTTLDGGGTPHTKSAYAEITSATTQAIAGFFLGFDYQGGGAPSYIGNMSWLVDIAVGAMGSEQIILPNHLLFGYSFNNFGQAVANMASPYLPIPIPEGSRIAARIQCSSGTNTDRLVGVTLYGVSH